jgi:hypothetical protein
MEENEEIRKDREALNEYLKKGNSKDFTELDNIFSSKAFQKIMDDESNFKVHYPHPNLFGLKTPARVDRGVIEIPKSMFDKKNPEYHRMKLKIFSIITVIEIGNIEGNIIHKVEVTNKRIREWFDYADTELKQHKESKKFLKELNLGEEIKTDWLAVGIVYRFKKNLVKKFWWRMGLLGIKERIKVFKREILAKKLKDKYKYK